LDDLAKTDLIFFDPDKGVRENLFPGPIHGSEHAKVSEINDYNWCDWLVIQFLQPRRNRFEQLVGNPIFTNIQKRKKKIVAFISGPVAFLYVTGGIDLILLQQVFKAWDTKISTQILLA